MEETMSNAFSRVTLLSTLAFVYFFSLLHMCIKFMSLDHLWSKLEQCINESKLCLICVCIKHIPAQVHFFSYCCHLFWSCFFSQRGSRQWLSFLPFYLSYTWQSSISSGGGVSSDCPKISCIRTYVLTCRWINLISQTCLGLELLLVFIFYF